MQNFNKEPILKTIILILIATLQLMGQSEIEYGSHNGQYIALDNTKVYYEEYGEGPPVLLLHGGMGSIADFKNIIPELSKNFRLIAMDSPSHGRSYSIDSLSYNILADYVVKLIDKLQLEKLNIIGYSDGAIVGMLVAHKIPDKIIKLVFGAGALSPHASKSEGLKMLQNFSPEMLPESFANYYKTKSPNPDHWESFVYNSRDMWLQDIWIPEDVLPKIQSKVLVLFGDKDQFIPLDHSMYIHHNLPNSELCILPNTFHNIYNNSRITNPVLMQFLSKE